MRFLGLDAPKPLAPSLPDVPRDQPQRRHAKTTHTTPKIREYITQEGNRLEVAPRPPVALTNTVSWRSEGIKHRKNEIFLDVVEKLNLLVSSNGACLSPCPRPR